MDDKLPASSDFSQGPQSYDTPSTSFEHKGEILRAQSPTKGPFGQSTQPSNMGTFTIRDKKGNDIPSQAVQDILKRVPKVGGELKPKKSKRSAEDVAKELEEFGISLQLTEDGKVDAVTIDSDQAPELTPCIKRYGVLEKDWNELQKKINVVEDVGVRTSYVTDITAAFEALSWLDRKIVDTSIVVKDVDHYLDSLDKLLEDFKKVIETNEKHNTLHNEPAQKPSSPEDLTPLRAHFTTLQTRIDTLQKKLGDDFRLRKFHADIIEKQEIALTQLFQDGEGTATQKDVRVLTHNLDTFEAFLLKIEEEADEFLSEKQKGSEPTGQQQAPTQEKEKRGEGDILPRNVTKENDIWHITVNGTKKVIDAPYFGMLYDTLVAYQGFYDTTQEEAPGYDISALTALKDAILDALLVGDLASADKGARKLGAAWRKAQEEISASLKKNTGSSDPSPEDEPSPEQKKPELSDNTWGGWPDIITKAKNGVWQYTNKDGTKEALDNQSLWSDLKTNMDTEMAAYIAFFKNGNTNKKKELYEDLIILKNEILAEIVAKKPQQALALVKIFPNKLEEKKEDWKKIEEEAVKEKEGRQKEEAVQQTYRLKFKEQEAEYEKQQKRVSGLVDVLPNGRGSIIRTQSEELKNDRELIQDKINKKEPIAEKDFIEYVKDLKRLSDELDAIIESIKKTYSPNVASVILNSANNTTGEKVILRKGGNLLTKDGKSAVSLEVWQEEQQGRIQAQKDKEKVHQARAQLRTMEDVKALQSFNDLYEKHREVYNQNREAYIAFYANKSWAPHDPNKFAVIKIFEAVITDIKQNKIPRKQAELNELAQAREKAKDETTKLKINGDYSKAKEDFDALREQLTEMESNLAILTGETSVLHTRNGKERLVTSHVRETYSPPHDPSMADVGVNRDTLTWKEKVAFDAAKKAQKERESAVQEEGTAETQQTGLYTPGDLFKVSKNERPAAEEKTTQLHTEEDIAKARGGVRTGMVRSVTQEDIDREHLKHTSTVAPGARYTEEEPTVYNEEQEESPVANEETQVHEPQEPELGNIDSLSAEGHQKDSAQEQVEKKHTAVNRLSETLQLNRLKKGAKDWRVLAGAILITFAAGKFVGNNFNQEEQNKGNQEQSQTLESFRPKTLGEAKKAIPIEELYIDYFKENSVRSLPARKPHHEGELTITTLRDDLLNGKDYTFHAFIAKYSREELQKYSNPAVRDKMSNLTIDDLFNAENLPGIDEKVRQYLCDIVTVLKGFIHISQPNYVSRETTTLEQLFDDAKWNATDAKK